MGNVQKENILERKLESKVSAVIPTYNRCPNSGKDIKYNPIWWAANSLFNQSNLGEIVFVDDASNDNFLETVKRIKDVSPVDVEINWIRNKKWKGSGVSRNIGVSIAKYDQIFFVDDDCVVISPKVLPNLQYAFNFLKIEGINVGAISPPLSGHSLESELVPSSEICKINQKKGTMDYCNTTNFPREYFENLENFYSNKERNIFRPLKVDVLGGVFICDKKAFVEAGGFPGTKWRNACSEELDLILNMQIKGYGVFYLPSLDNKFRVFHCRYGDKKFERISYNEEFMIDGLPFNEILKRSLEGEVMDQGNRVSKSQELYSSIISHARIMFKYFGAQVGLNNLRTRCAETKGNKEKKEIFRKAVTDGITLMKSERIIPSRMSDYIREKYL